MPKITFYALCPPRKDKLSINSWYVGSDGLRIADALFSIDYPSEINYQTTAYKREFLTKSENI